MELKEWKGDALHIDSDVGKLDGYGKTNNYIVTERESGKSTLLWKKVYNSFKRENRPSLILRRYQNDITDMYIEDVEKIINEFTEQELHFDFRKKDLQSGGQMDLKLNGEIFCRIIALNSPVSKLKSMKLDKVKYIMFDEFICNKRIGERYLNDEPFRVKEIYNTYNRHTVKFGLSPIKVYMFGNPYSLYNPFFSDKLIPTNKLYPGALLADKDYCVWCYQIKPELKEKILKQNPLYQFDDAYKKYAFDGRAIQDTNIRVEQQQPKNFKLEYIFKIHGKHIGIFHGYIFEPEILFYWCKLLEPSEFSTKRNIFCFDFGDMANRTILMSNNGKKLYQSFKECIERRYVAFASIEESWLIEEIYQEL